MSSIAKLSIQGIRSFGSASEDCQKIEFVAPVTLILGDNGCGKTTIIECLKYALTGDFPPSSDRGKSFVHDPKIFSQGDTMAQIKLQVKNLVGEHLTICRSMKISHRRGKSTFETLDSTVVYPGESISKRVVDADVTMSEFMGVSKAIINNVLFCHQEDSNWPLEEAKKLKEKFDAIFGITEYNKAIETMIKKRKEVTDELKVKQANLNFLAHLKQEMEDKSMSLQRAQEKCDSVQLACTRCDDDMKPIDDRLLEIRKVEYEVGKYQARQVELDTNLKNTREQVSTLDKKIKTSFGGTLQELDRELHTFAEKMSAKQLERSNLDGELRRLQTQQQALQKLYMEQDKKLHTANEQRQQQQRCNAQCAEKIRILATNLNIPLGEAEARADVPSTVDKLQAAMQREQQQIGAVGKQHDVDDQQRQSEIDRLRVDMTKLEEAVITLRKQKQQNEKESGELLTKIAAIERTTQDLKRVSTELERVEQMHRGLSGKFNMDGVRLEINEKKATVQQQQEKFRQLDERLTALNAMGKQMAELALKDKEHEKKQQEVRRVRNKHSDNFKKLFCADVSTNYRRQLQDVYERLRREIKALNEQIGAQKLKEQSCEIKRKNLKDEITRLEREHDDAKERTYEQCHATPYDELLTKSQAAVSKYQLELGAHRSAESMYKRYIEKIEEEPCCPLCTTPMSSERASKLSDDLLDEIHKLPENIKRAETALKAAQLRYTNLLQLKPQIERIAKLDVDIPQSKQQLQCIQAELAACGSEHETLQLSLAEPSSDLELANGMFGDMSLLDEAMKEVSRLGADIAALKLKLPEGFADSESVDVVQAEKNAVSEQLAAERALLEQKQRDYEKTVDGLNVLREKKNALKDQQIKLQEGIQSLPQLKERQADLGTLGDTLQLELQDSQMKVQPLKEKLGAASAEKTRLKEANRKKLTQLQSKYETNNNIERDIQRLHADVLQYEQLQLATEIARLQDTLKRNKDERNDMAKEVSTITDSLEALKLECLDQVALERDLKDNRELKLLQQKQTELQEQKQKLSQQLGDLDFNRVAREKNTLIKQRDDATVRKGELLGQIGEIRGQVKKLRHEIEEPKYKDALQNYRTASYEVEISKRLINDLGSYRVALEWALIQFHASKMERINSLIREYWRLIYQGNDIDYIQVQTDELKTDANSADRRRSYNYRVIQSKNNSEIEMRGRCSAGQRVLACLIIRIALAETFGSRCGVFALDEPTTNLDRKNIISLCDALNRVVEERQVQTNFMLIIITHDEEFISTLGKINSYHRVLRNTQCKSIIRKTEVGYA